MAKDSVIIISGGMDSTTLLYEYQDRIALAITFDYGSTQNERERRKEQRKAELHSVFSLSCR